MNDKGFTLIEIIAIIMVLVAVVLISFPALINMSKKDQEKQYENMKNDLCIAGKTYMYSNIEKFEDLTKANSTIELDINELILYGNVDKNLKNPKTDKSVENDKLIYTVLDDFSLDCKYVEE